MRRPSPVLLSVFTLSLVACASPAPPVAVAPVPSVPTATRYADPSAWLCLPGRDDACARDLSATVLHPDGTRTVERHDPAKDPKLDCFYVYPTVDVSLTPGNHEDFTDVTIQSGAAASQVARFREACAVYAPLYRQATIGSYLHEDSLAPRLAFAFSDVEAAFREYLARYNHGRPFVLVGHSQGGDMVVRLLQRFVDGDPALRSRLVLAMPIGWSVEVPKGKTVGGTFANIPVCTKNDETGCVIAYRSHEAGSVVSPGRHQPTSDREEACVNPASIEGNALTPLSRAYLSTGPRSSRYVNSAGIDTPFLELPEFYAAQCAEGPDGYRYLAISLAGAAGDARQNPVSYERLPLHKQLGLHVLDMQLPQGNLVDLVAKRAARLP